MKILKFSFDYRFINHAMKDSNFIWHDMISAFIGFHIELNFIDRVNHIHIFEFRNVGYSIIHIEIILISFVNICMYYTIFHMMHRYYQLLYIKWIIVDNIAHEIIYSFNFVLRSTSFILPGNYIGFYTAAHVLISLL